MLNTGGGTVTGYGLAAAQLVRIKQGGLPLTICVEQVMSACRNRALTGGGVRFLKDSPNLSRARSYSPPRYASEAHEEDNTKSTLVSIRSPWTTHCQTFWSTYDVD